MFLRDVQLTTARLSLTEIIMSRLFKWCTDEQYREQRSLERWERERAQGKVRFVLRQTMIFPMMMSAINDLSGYIRDGAVPVFRMRSILIYLLIGMIAAFMGWSNREAKYKRALLNRRQSFGDNQIVLR
jgi:hypothetical protein